MEKFVLNYQDIMNMFDCGERKAYEIIQSIKTVSDMIHLRGKVTKRDLEIWYNSYGG